MMANAGTYLDALFLLLGDNSDRSRQLVKEFLVAIERHQGSGKRDMITAEDPLIDAYRSLIKTVLNERIHQDDKTAAKILLLNVKSNEIFKSYPVERDLITDVLTAAEPITATMIDTYLKKLRNAVISAEIDDTTRKLFARSQTISRITDADDQANEIQKLKSMMNDALKSIEQRSITSDAKATETYVSLSDRESISRSLNTYIERNITGVVKTGLQGLNKALGSRGGMGLGETYVFAAPSHHYKSGMLVSILVWTALYNKFTVAPGKKALLYFVSLENEVSQNLMDIFRMVYCRIEKRHVDLKTLSVDFIMDWIVNYFGQFDVEILIDRYEPHNFSYGTFMKRYTAFMEMNYQMILFDLDYLSEVRGIDPGDTFSPQGQIQMIKENYTKFFHTAKTQGYLFTTGHQLTKKANEQGTSDRYAVKKFSSHLIADSSDVERIIDGLIFLYLTTNIDGIKFLTAQLRKNRGCRDTPEKDKFFAYAFTEYGIMDDVDDIPRFVQDIDGYNIDGVQSDAVEEAAMF